MKRILIRCDQNKYSGFGHFSRCLSLARHILMTEKVSLLFLGNFSEFSISLLNRYNIEYRKIEEKKFESFKEQDFIHSTHIIFDSYFINQDYLNKISKLNAKSIFIDDTCTLDFKNIDLVINFRVNAEKMFSYNSKDEALGTDYFIYKPEFKAIKQQSTFKQTIRSILVFLGGIKIDKNSYEAIFKAIESINPKIDIFVISNELEFKNKKVTVLKPTFDMETYLKKIDFIINGGGLVKYESIFCNIPSAVLSSTKLQYEDTCILDSKHILYNLGMLHNICINELTSNLKHIIENEKFRKEIFENSKTFFPINSVKNIMDKINYI